MKKLIKAVFFLLAVSLAAAAVYLGAMKDRTALNRAPGSAAADAERDAEDHTGSGSDPVPDDPAVIAAAVASFKPAGIPEASGTAVEENASAIIDYSNTEDGYVMVDYTEDTENNLKVQVEGPATTYQYDLERDSWTTFPLSDGDGNYRVTVYEGVANDRYTTVLSASFDVALSSEFAPFLHSNQYVDYDHAANTMAKTAELTAGTTDTLEKVGRIYEYVTDNVVYDTQKAASVESGYLPVLDDVLETKRGICFDYAALMAGMLRSCGIPCKLVVGYAGDAYHAWVNVWTDESGETVDAIWFDGKSWQLMDPTFASANNRSEAIMQYIGDGDNYTPVYQY